MGCLDVDGLCAGCVRVVRGLSGVGLCMGFIGRGVCVYRSADLFFDCVNTLIPRLTKFCLK